MTKNNNILKLELNADTKNLSYLRESLFELLSRNQFDEQKIMEVQLVVDELCTNLIKYSYQSDATKVFVVIAEIVDGKIKVQIVDEGKPFDLTKFDSPNISEHIKNPHKGGLGIPFIKLLSSNIKYLPHPDYPNKNLTEILI